MRFCWWNTPSWRGPAGTRRYGVDDGLPGNFISALARSADGSLWVGTATGLGRIRDGRAETLDLVPWGGAEFIFGMHYERGRDRLWLATDRGLLLHTPGSGS